MVETLMNWFSWIPLIDRGGVLMIPIFFCSVLALGIFIERLIALRASSVLPSDFLVELETLARKRDVEHVVLLCKKNDQVPLARILIQGLRVIGMPRGDLMGVLESYGRVEAARLERLLGVMALVTQIAPLLGLLGTVTGMIRMYTAIAATGLGDPAALSRGIGEALLTTAAGLTVAIPTIVAHRYLASRSNAHILRMEAVTVETINTLRGEASEV